MASYQALYRKWRPSTFSDVTGQSHVTSTLKNEVALSKIGHAYIFTGTRGTGKTTCAKILAKAVSCLNPRNGDPCNECENCRLVNSNSTFDIVEIDAASNNKVDNIREIIDEVNYTPANLKYKVYIIDEVHMLTQSAYNALLKTLEEPPKHAIFILATTEIQKVPATILSRCQRFDFKRLTLEQLAKRIDFVARCENIDISEQAIRLICKNADGAMRDALSLLDQCWGGKAKITEADVTEIIGICENDYLFNIAHSIADNDTATALTLLSALYYDSKDMSVLCSELISLYRDVLILKTVASPKQFLNLEDSSFSNLSKLGDKLNLETAINNINILTDALLRLSKNLDKKIEAEIAVIRLSTPSLNEDFSSLAARVCTLESKLSSNQISFAPPSVKETTTQCKPDNSFKSDVTAPAVTQTDKQEEKPLQKKSQSSPLKTSCPPMSEINRPASALDNCRVEKWSEICQVLSDMKVIPLCIFIKGSKAKFENGKIVIYDAPIVLEGELENAQSAAALSNAIATVYKASYPFEIGKSTPKATNEAKALDDFFEANSDFIEQL